MNHQLTAVAWLLSLGSSLVLPLTAEAGQPADAARAVVAAVRREAQRNAQRPAPLKGDELTELYIKTAATAARKLPADHAVAGFLLGLGIALDDSEILRKNPVTAILCRQVERGEERKQRLAVLGKPTMRGRRDLCQHFAVSCALTQVVGPTLAEAAGLLKELSDMHGGTGFSFADMAANLSGIHLASRLKNGERTLAAIETKFRVADFVHDPAGLREELNAEQFARAYGSPEDKRFKETIDKIREKIRDLPGHR